MKDYIPLAVAILAFVLNSIFQYYLKNQNIRDRIAGEVISTCDKMIRYALEVEHSALTLRFWYNMKALYPLSNKQNEENNRNATTEIMYYHRKAEDAGLKLDLLKSELKKYTKDLQSYWHNTIEASKIIKLMSEAVLKEPRRFEETLREKYVTQSELANKYGQIIENVQNELIFEGIGFNLVRIQKIIDPDSPTLLLSKELEKELMEKIRNT